MQSRISLSGHKSSGKSTVAAHLVQAHGYTELSFADPLKRLVIDIFAIDPKYCWDPAYKELVIPELGVSARQLMQVIGSELFRDRLPALLPALRLRGSSVWIHSLVKRVEHSTSRIVVSDTRFDDEYQALATLGFRTTRVLRSTPDIADAHQSELGCASDFTLDNHSGIEELHALVNASFSRS